MRANYKTELANMKDQDFFEALGRRISDFRQARGMTQAELAQALGLRQQVIATYELATRRLPASLLIPITETLGTTIEALLGIEPAKMKPGPVPKLQRQFDAAADLPQSEQRFLSQMLDRFLSEGHPSPAH